jgi:hypothetical protein
MTVSPSLQQLVFEPSTIYVGFVAEKSSTSMGTFPEYMSFFPVSMIPPMLNIHLHLPLAQLLLTE